MTTDLWDKHGHAVAYVDGDKESIYMQDGTPAGWLSGNGIYTYGGKFLGWLYEGWIFGRDGKCVLFTERAQPGAVKPFRQPAIDRGKIGSIPMAENFWDGSTRDGSLGVMGNACSLQKGRNPGP